MMRYINADIIQDIKINKSSRKSDRQTDRDTQKQREREKTKAIRPLLQNIGAQAGSP